MDAGRLAQRAAKAIEERSAKGNARARALLQRSVKIDPTYASAWRQLALTHLSIVGAGPSDDTGAELSQALAYGTRAFVLDERTPDSMSLLAILQLYRRSFDRALELGEAALAAGPNSADSILRVADIHRYAADPSKAVKLVRSAMRLGRVATPCGALRGSQADLGQTALAQSVKR